ncbi:MAG: hypothetical protein GX838_00425 [Clostridiaceae bacterium]|nr:hypothetical protein [Clostridiaceae bacterium]
MKDSQEKGKKNQFLEWLIIGLVLVGAGLFALLYPNLVSGYLTLVIGLVAIFAGGIYAAIYIRGLTTGGGKVASSLTKAVISLVVGLLLLIKPDETIKYLLVAAGVYFIVQALAGVIFALVMRAFSKGLFWIVFVPVLLLLITGLLIIIAPTALGVPVDTVIGFGLALNGLLYLVKALGSKMGKKTGKKEMPSAAGEDQAPS